MRQDVGFFGVAGAALDIVFENGDIKPDNGLETSALISVFSDKRVSFEELPGGEEDRRGWWADLVADPEDDEIGSKLWLLHREKTTDAVATEMESYLADAFNWMIEDGLAASLVIDSEIIDTNNIRGSVQITKPDGDNIPLRFVWDGQRLKITE